MSTYFRKKVIKALHSGNASFKKRKNIKESLNWALLAILLRKLTNIQILVLQQGVKVWKQKLILTEKLWKPKAHPEEYWEYCRYFHCVKSAQIRSFFCSVFSCIQSKYRKIWTRKKFVLGHFSRSVYQDLEVYAEPFDWTDQK